MTAENVLQRLEKVKRTGRDKWQACCPAHDDKGPSLAIRELDDGRTLLHCFAGCGAAEVLAAIGLEFSDLFPKTDSHHLPKARKPWNATDVLNALAFEILLAWNFAKAMGEGEVLNDTDRGRLLTCATRMQRGLDAING